MSGVSRLVLGPLGRIAERVTTSDVRRDCIDTDAVSHAVIEYLQASESRPDNPSQSLSQHFITKKLSASDHTHLFFGGGKGTVPDGLLTAATLLYTVDLVNATTSQAVRQIECFRNCEVFPMFFDMDLKVDTLPEDVEDLHMEYFRHVVSAVRRFYPSLASDARELDAIVCSRPRLRTDEGFKFGYHIHFPNLVVGKDAAMQMRESVLALFHREYYERGVGTNENSWYDVFDLSVYINNALRTIGSFKVDGRSRKPTQLDDHNNAATYWPSVALKGDGTAHESLQSDIDKTFTASGCGRTIKVYSYQLLRERADDPEVIDHVRRIASFVNMCRVRVCKEVQVTPGYTVYEGAPRPGSLKQKGDLRQLAMEQAKQERRGQLKPTDARGYELLPEGSETMALRDAVQGHLRQLVSGDGAPIWPVIEVDKIMRPGPSGKRKRVSDSLLVTVRGEGSSFCLNLQNRRDATRAGSDHGSNRIYFWVSSSYPFVTQRCHCDCNTVRYRYAGLGGAIKCCNFSSSSAGRVVYNTKPSEHLATMMRAAIGIKDSVGMMLGAKLDTNDLEQMALDFL